MLKNRRHSQQLGGLFHLHFLLLFFTLFIRRIQTKRRRQPFVGAVGHDLVGELHCLLDHRFPAEESASWFSVAAVRPCRAGGDKRTRLTSVGAVRSRVRVQSDPTSVLADIFGADPAPGRWMVEEMDVDALVSPAAPRLLSTQRLGHHHARPPRVTLQLGPHQGAGAERALGAAQKEMKQFQQVNGLLESC